MAKSSKDAYREIHEGLYAAVELSVEECNHEEAIKYADMMAELERGKVEFLEAYDIKGGLLKEYLNG